MWMPYLDKRRKDEVMEIEMLQYGETYELRNGDSCVYVCRLLDAGENDITCELVLINTFTGEEYNINDYNDDLTHCEDNQLDIVGFGDHEGVIGCEYCSGNVNNRRCLLDDGYSNEVYIDEDNRVAFSGDCDLEESVAEHKLKYCPMCGREL